ncbi:hypothetical protein M2263_001830 [Providencia alcalifaciens]|nr:hypothetical protein [Providencia alcalifaciens]
MSYQEIINYMNVVILSSMAIRVFLCNYVRKRDSYIGLVLIWLCVWQIYQLLTPNDFNTSLSNLFGDTFVCILVFAAKGNIMQVFKKVRNEQLQIQPAKRK